MTGQLMRWFLFTLLFSASLVHADRVPDAAQSLPDDTVFLFPVEQMVRGGFAGSNEDTGFHSGGGVSGVFFIEGGRLGLYADVTAAGGEGTPHYFAYAQGDLKFRKRWPVGDLVAFDPMHRIWIGAGLDLSGRYSQSEDLNSYFRTGPVVVLGWLREIAGTCVLELYAKAGVMVHDTQTQSSDHWFRPSAGAETITRCGELRVQLDAQRVFGIGERGGNTDLVKLETAYNFTPFRANGKKPQFGVFGKGELIREQGVGDLPNATRESFLTGLQVLF